MLVKGATGIILADPMHSWDLYSALFLFINSFYLVIISTGSGTPIWLAQCLGKNPEKYNRIGRKANHNQAQFNTNHVQNIWRDLL